ncbi:MAG TPA: hypothetical protein DIC35_05300 [Candidatus Moranbacteria bacterium]|nr:hypothetical protein [Candidatus Moranbacteria bacterium]
MNQFAQNKNNNALFIGISLILVIFLITFMRVSYSENQNQKEKEESSNNIEDEVIAAMKNATKLSSDELNKKINSKEPLNLIDIREKSEFEKEHLPNSVNTPLSEIKGSIGILEKNKNYILIDANSFLVTTAYAIKTFSELGFKNISYLDGGFLNWKNNYYQTISAGDPKSFADQSKVNYINSDKLKEMSDMKKNITIIDVRKSAEYGEGHIKNAINIFLEDIESKQGEIPTKGRIILYGNDSLGAFQAAVRLFDMGIFNVYALSDGFNAWKSKQYEIAR